MSNNERDASLIQALLIAPEVNKYLHTGDAPGRLPVVVQVSNGNGMNEFGLEVGGEPVRFVDEAQNADDGARFVIDSMTSSNGNTSISFSYSVEGIRGSADISGDPGSFQAGNIRIIEQ